MCHTKFKPTKIRRKTFTKILKEARASSAESCWRRAEISSALRHDAKKKGQLMAARALSAIKIRSVERVVSLAPDLCEISIDSDLYIGLTSVRFQGRSKLHLPALANIYSWKLRSCETLEDVDAFAA